MKPDIRWHPVSETPPERVPLLLLLEYETAVVGRWSGRDFWSSGWSRRENPITHWALITPPGGESEGEDA